MDPAGAPTPQDPDDDISLHNYQDDLDTDNDVRDPIIDEASDDPVAELGVDSTAFKDELDKYDFDEGGRGNDDEREALEDIDEDGART